MSNKNLVDFLGEFVTAINDNINGGVALLDPELRFTDNTGASLPTTDRVWSEGLYFRPIYLGDGELTFKSKNNYVKISTTQYYGWYMVASAGNGIGNDVITISLSSDGVYDSVEVTVSCFAYS